MMPSILHIIVVEDNNALRQATVDMLNCNGFAAIGLSCAEDVDDLTLPSTPRLFVIDVNLPDEDGLSLAHRLRHASPRVGIVITSARVQLHERVQGYEAGADIYLPKPVAPAELLATLNVLRSRIDGEKSATQSWVLEREVRSLQGPAGSVHLTESEARLVSAFAMARDRTLERWQVGVQLKPVGEPISTDSLQNRISMLRKKFQQCGAQGDAIVAIRNSGYRLHSDVQVH